MGEDTNSDLVALKRRYEECGQGHVFAYVDELSSKDRLSLIEQLSSIPVEQLSHWLQSAQESAVLGTNNDNTIEPFTFTDSIGSETSSPTTTEFYWKKGLEAIGRGEVAALVLAGGQGTRLGFDGPKGMFDIGLPSHSSLFQLIALRILKLKRLAKSVSSSPSLASGENPTEHSCSLPFYIMTSPINHETTREYFANNDYFGLGGENVYFFQQGMLPCLNADGKIILETPSRVAMAPDGNGGIYPSLMSSGAFHDMHVQRGIRYLHVFSIDNALVKPADPAFVGFCIERGADCGNKSTRKTHPHEKVGVVALRNGKPCVVEYSEITPAMAELIVEGSGAPGRLAFGSGNICNHFFTLEFLKRQVFPNFANFYHLAHKKIPYYDGNLRGTVHQPAQNNGVKLESFIFDVFPLAERFVVWEVERSREFAPVKNPTAEDSPESARAAITKLHRQWLRDAGAHLDDEKGGPGIDNDENLTSERAACEISPLVSYGGEGLKEVYHGKTITVPFYLKSF